MMLFYNQLPPWRNGGAALRIAVIPCLLSFGPRWLKPLEERLAAKQRMEQDQRSHLGRAVPKRKSRLDMARNLGISWTFHGYMVQPLAVDMLPKSVLPNGEEQVAQDRSDSSTAAVQGRRLSWSKGADVPWSKHVFFLIHPNDRADGQRSVCIIYIYIIYYILDWIRCYSILD